MKNQSNIGNTITMGQILEFNVAFPDEKPLTIEQYLAGGSRSIILNVAAFFLGFKPYNSKYKDNKELLGAIFNSENNAFANEVYTKVNVIKKKADSIEIINTYSSLKLFEYFFSKSEEQETQSQAEFERNLFKAYLVINSEFTKKQTIAFSSCEGLDDELKMPLEMFCMNYPVSDKSNYNILQIWTTQVMKSIYLFQFLESHKRTQPLLTAFLAYFNCLTWQDYLKQLLPLTMPAIKNEGEAHTDIIVERGDKFNGNCAFIEKLMVQENDELDKNDFLTLRAKPFYKVSEGVYRIIFNLFVVEKIFKGIYFSLRDVNKSMPDSLKIKEIRSFYGDEFSEKILCYNVIESIYPENCISFSGKKLAEMKIDGAPDYYIRKGKNIILFESKDFLILAEKKTSFDFNIYEEEFQKVLYYEIMPDGREKHKAVMQLINNVRKILQKEFPADTDYNYREVFIYPVLLTHDHQYDTPGFNELINSWFQEELIGLQEEGLFIHYVKPLSVVNIDSLMYNQVGLSNDIPLHEMLNLYHENKKFNIKEPKIKTQDEYEEFLIEYRQKRMSKITPFALFIDKYFQKNNLWKFPSILDEVKPVLFKDELDARTKTQNCPEMKEENKNPESLTLKND